MRRPSCQALLCGWPAFLALAACGLRSDVEFPRLARTADVDLLLLERLEAAWSACERGASGALLELAEIYDANGLPGLAARTYELVLTSLPAQAEGGEDPERARIHYHLGRAQEQAGEPEQALGSFRRALALAPGYAPAHWRAGALFLERGLFMDAESAFRRALELDPLAVDAHLGLARIQLLWNEPQSAIETLQPIAERNPRERFVHGLLARAQRALGDERRAAAELRREERATQVTRVDPWEAEVRSRACSVSAVLEQANAALVAGDAGGALAILEPAWKKRPLELPLVLLLAKALIDQGSHERALAILEQARAAHPDQYRFELLSGLALQGQRAHRRALEHLLRARALNPAYGPTLAALGEVQAQLGLHAEAEESLAAAIEAGEEDLRTALFLGQVQLEREAFARALVTLRGACEGYPNSAAAWTALAEAQARSGDPSGARASLAEAERRDPGYERLPLVRALVESGAGASR